MALLYDLLEDRKNIEEEYKIFVLPFLLRNSELASRYRYTLILSLMFIYIYISCAYEFCFVFYLGLKNPNYNLLNKASGGGNC